MCHCPGPKHPAPHLAPRKRKFQIPGTPEKPPAPQAELPSSDPLFLPFSAGLPAAANSVCLGPTCSLQPLPHPDCLSQGRAKKGHTVEWYRRGTDSSSSFSYFPVFSKFSSLSVD